MPIFQAHPRKSEDRSYAVILFTRYLNTVLCDLRKHIFDWILMMKCCPINRGLVLDLFVWGAIWEYWISIIHMYIYISIIRLNIPSMPSCLPGILWSLCLKRLFTDRFGASWQLWRCGLLGFGVGVYSILLRHWDLKNWPHRARPKYEYNMYEYYPVLSMTIYPVLSSRLQVSSEKISGSCCKAISRGLHSLHRGFQEPQPEIPSFLGGQPNLKPIDHYRYYWTTIE